MIYNIKITRITHTHTHLPTFDLIRRQWRDRIQVARSQIERQMTLIRHYEKDQDVLKLI